MLPRLRVGTDGMGGSWVLAVANEVLLVFTYFISQPLITSVTSQTSCSVSCFHKNLTFNLLF